MRVLIGFIAALGFSLVLREPLKRFPVAVYAVCVALVAVFLCGGVAAVSTDLYRLVLPYFRQCLFAFGLFSVVMMVGALPEGSRAYAWLAPVRGQLSIVAAIFTVGHFSAYVQTYLAHISAGFLGMGGSTMFALAVAVLLLVLLVVLAVTSFNVVRAHMNPRAWKLIQRWAYVFYGLAYVHLMFLLVPTAEPGSRPFEAVVAYSAIVGVYAVARIYKAVAGKR